jgi:hypothetical protein
MFSAGCVRYAAGVFCYQLSKSYKLRSLGSDVTEADHLFHEFQTKMGNVLEEEEL